MDKDLIDALKKRANGMFYEETYEEFERMESPRFLLCKKHNRILDTTKKSWVKNLSFVLNESVVVAFKVDFLNLSKLTLSAKDIKNEKLF